MLGILKCLLLEQSLFLIWSNSFSFFYPLKSSLGIFRIAEIAMWHSNIGPSWGIIGKNNVRPIVVFVVTVTPLRTISSDS